MILRTLTLALVLGSSLTSPLFAGCERGGHLVGEVGGVPGAAGLPGGPGIPGAIGILEYSDFYALDNPGPIAIGAAVPFPTDGATSGTIARITSSTFNLPAAGTYLVQFQVDVSNAGQLMLTLNGVDLAATVVGRATGSTQIVGIYLVTTSAVNSTLAVVNPSGNPVALTLPANDGGSLPISDHLSILRIQ